MVGCSAAIAAMAGGRLTNLVFNNQAHAAGTAAGTDEIMVMIFLRGGCDGLSLLAPFSDPVYQSARRIDKTRTGNAVGLFAPGTFAADSADKPKEALEIAPNNATYSGGFGLHSNASGLNSLYTGGKLAFVHACGLNDDTRSHFDAQDYIDRGTPGQKNTGSGWITRHLQFTNPQAALATVAVGSSAPVSLLGSSDALAISAIDSYNLNGIWRYTSNTGSNNKFKDAMLNTLQQCYVGDTLIQGTGKRTIDTIKSLREKTAPGNGTGYPANGFGDALKTLAQLIKLNMGLQVATVDLGGWDHHEGEGVHQTYGPFYNQAKTLSDGLYAFYNEIAATAYASKVTIMVMSEFGRRLGANASDGTDHGHGGLMLVLGENVNGGKVYGNWPGLADLDQKQDLKVTTDFRTVVGEVVVKRLGNPHLGTVFPGITANIYAPGGSTLGVVKTRTDAPSSIDYTSTIASAFLPLVVK
jgi:uncharacterized protein (DUF1501 family)